MSKIGDALLEPDDDPGKTKDTQKTNCSDKTSEKKHTKTPDKNITPTEKKQIHSECFQSGKQDTKCILKKYSSSVNISWCNTSTEKINELIKDNGLEINIQYLYGILAEINEYKDRFN